MPYQVYNRIPTPPEPEEKEKKSVDQLRNELDFINKASSSPATNKKPKAHPDYDVAYEADKNNISAHQAIAKKTPPKVQQSISGTKKQKVAKARPQKRKLTTEQIEAIRKKQLELKNKRRAHRKESFRVFIARTACSVIVASVLFVLSFTVFLFTFNSSDAANTSIDCIIEEKEKRLPFKYGSVYICGNDIASLCNFTVTGDDKQIKYISHGAGNESVSFAADSTLVHINGTELHLLSPTYSEEGKLYIPLSFFKDYCSGLSVLYHDDGKSISISRNILNKEAIMNYDAEPVYESITFKIKAVYPIEKIHPSNIPDI